ncbi:conserved hypothetical protein [Tenacibaculum litopenaei]|jgi:uncharacterized membrane protein YvbJ|uniref:zinc-ribbon domain-containing protein n=1 Tax=Tenacibaculum litopenaei TaxID=396016 RepID=UPI003894F111
MAIIACKECSKEVSDKATACPHCGYPMNPQKVKTEVQVKSTTEETPKTSLIDKVSIVGELGTAASGCMVLVVFFCAALTLLFL